MVEVLQEEKESFGAENIQATIEQLSKLTNEMIGASQLEERKEEEEGGLTDPLQLRWSKEALCIVTQHLSEQQKISLLSEQLTLLTYQPQEATNDDVNFKEELKQIVDQITFEVEQKELAVLAAPTRLQQKRKAVESIYNKFRSELEAVENGFCRPQIDREGEEDGKTSALAVFKEGYQKFIEQNQSEIDDIENQQQAFRVGKKDLIESMRTMINDFKKQVRQTGSVVSLRSLFAKHYNLTVVRGLADQSVIRGSLVWPEEKDFANLPPNQLKDVQLQRIQYYKVGSILSMQFHLSNGMVSPFAGNSGIDRCQSSASIPANRQVRKVRIKASKNWVNEIRFCDENDYTIAEVKADSGVGDWYDIMIEKGERIIGFQEEHD
jgi:hypothetical protein